MPPRKNDLTQAQAQDLANYFLGRNWHAYISFGEHCLLRRITAELFHSTGWRAVFRLAGVNLPVRPQFSPQKDRIMQGDKCVAVACSANFATRTANALNEYEPDRRGL